VTELERFVDCSSMWFLDRMIDPKTMDRELDARMRGLDRAPGPVPVLLGPAEELGIERVGPDELEARCASCAVASTRPSTACGWS
jgi:hypothetical protein